MKDDPSENQSPDNSDGLIHVGLAEREFLQELLPENRIGHMEYIKAEQIKKKSCRKKGRSGEKLSKNTCKGKRDHKELYIYKIFKFDSNHHLTPIFCLS